MKLMKKISVSLAAVMCCSVMSVTAYASETDNTYTVSGSAVAAELDATASTTSAAYKEAVKLAGTKYNSALAKIIEKYNKKTAKSTVTYKKSRTKKQLDKISEAGTKAIDNEKDAKGYSVAIVGKNYVLFGALKSNKVAMITYGEEVGIGIYIDDTSYTITDLSSKQKLTTESESMLDSVDSSTMMATTASISDTEKASVFKFKYKKKSYTYELFEIDGVKGGYLFDSKNNMVGLYDEELGYCTVKYSFSPKSSAFEVPDDYTEMEY